MTMKLLWASLLVCVLAISAWGQPAKSEIGSKENPYYTRTDIFTLKEYFDIHHTALNDKFEARIKAMESAVAVASKSMDTRLDAMNEFRASLKDQATQFVNKAEYASQMKSIDTDLRILMTAKDRDEGKASVNQVYIAWLISFLSLSIAVAGIILKQKRDKNGDKR